MKGKAIFFSDSVTEAIAEVQENHEAYTDGLEELNEYILQSSTDNRKTVDMLATVCIMRRIVRKIKAGLENAPEQNP